MVKKKEYKGVKYPTVIIKKAFLTFFNLYGKIPDKKIKQVYGMSMKRSNISEDYDSIDEFFSDYILNFDNARIESKVLIKGTLNITSLSVEIVKNGFDGYDTTITICLPRKDLMNKIFLIFDESYEQYKSSKKQVQVTQRKISVFIGHGRSELWKELKNHLQDKQKLNVISYENEPRAGYLVMDTIQSMAYESSIAFLVHTAEDEDSHGNYHARENVIHETGFFQGKLGVSRAIIVLEEGCNEYSNIHGINQIRFSKGNIKEIFGEVIATIKREFQQKDNVK